MSCGCNHINSCDGCAPCNCCTPCPPIDLPVCNDPEPCDVALDSQCVIYTGGDLPCIGLTASGDPAIIRLSDILESIDTAFCQFAVGSTFVANTNCILLDGTGTQLDPISGSIRFNPSADNLVSCTSAGLTVFLNTDDSDCITLSGVGTSGDPLIADITLDPDPNNIISCGVDGLLATTSAVNIADTNCINLSGTGSVSSPITADPIISTTTGNILTCTANGLLSKLNVNTSAGCVALSGNGTSGTPLAVSLTIDSSLQCVGNTLGVNSSNVVTANNALTKTGVNIQLGGALVIPTTITTDPTNTLTFAGLSANTTPTYLLSQDGSNVTTKTLTSTFISGITGLITADNGLTKTLNNIQLGGLLIQNTLVDLDSYKLSLLDSGADPTGIEIIPGAANTSDWTTTNTNRISGKTYHNDHVWINGDKSITVNGSATYTIATDLKLNVGKTTGYRSQLENGTATMATYVQGGLIAGNSDVQLFGSKHVLAWLPTSQNPQFTEETLASSFHEFVFEPHYTAAASSNDLNGKACAIAARGYFVWNNDLDKFTGIRIQNPQADGTTNYTGTVTEMVGLEIEDQRGGGMDTHITKSYGINQMGANDINVFKSQDNRFTNLPVFANNALAVLGGLTQGALYRTATGVAMIVY